MIMTLTIMTLADENSEFDVLFLGIFTIIMIVGMYVLVPIFTVKYICRNRKQWSLWRWECVISTSEQRSFVSSSNSVIENQCKEKCVLNAILGKNEDRDVFCKFQTLSGYGWSKTPEEFEEMMNKASLNPLW